MKYSFFLFFIFITFQTLAEDCGNKIIRFEDYPVKEIFQGSSVPLNLKLVKKKDLHFFLGLKPRKNLHPNFSGHYRIIPGGCGTMCKRYVAIDLKDGEPYDLGISAALGISYKLNSSLVIVDPEKELKEWNSDPENRQPINETAYYKWVDGKLEPICVRKFR
jgi:hypothetical protein